MSLTSYVFFLLVIFIFVLLYLSNNYLKEKKSISVSNTILLISSYVFIIYIDYRFALILLLLTLSTYFFGRYNKYSHIGIIISIILLGVFKYTNFFIDSFSKLVDKDFVALSIILPLGISFYTFSAISYLIDIKREKIKPKDFKSVALYLAYFPKITSGPIQRSNDFFEQIDKKRNIGWNTFSIGIQIYVIGLFKKIVIADRLAVFVNQVYDTPLAFSSFTVLLAVISYSLQIYFDFSGYSDMAIGVSKIIGIELPRNFNLPYLSHNVTELWKRWHITLSTWLQDYVYISFGGNRKGKIRTYVNLILTMLIGGIWHGANWTYIIWGLLHGIALSIHKIWMKITCSQNTKHTILSKIFSILITFLFTSFCWIFFRANTIGDAFIIIKRIFGLYDGIVHPYFWSFISLIILIIISIVATIKSKPLKDKLTKYNISYVEGFYPIVDLNTFCGLLTFFILIGLTIGLAYTGGSPFIYGNY